MTAAPRFIVPVKDLDYGDRDLDESIPVEWLGETFAGTEAVPRGPGHLAVTLSKTGRRIMVRGTVEAEVTMPCARTLDPVRVPLAGDLFLLLSPRAASPGGPPRHGKPSEGRGRRPDETRDHGPPRSGKGKRKGRREAAPEEGSELAPEDAAEDTYDGEKVVLDGFVREFLLLELPLVPLREDLRSEETPAIDGPPEPAPPLNEASGRRPETAIDPRLLPLSAIANRLKDRISKKE